MVSSSILRLGDYVVERELRAGRSWLVRDPRGRRLVLKVLDSDCLLHGQLHPSIRERLTRVRELAQKNVAVFHGVERVEGRAMLVWQYIPGEQLSAHASGLSSPADLLTLIRELLLAVETLHARGIVHGSLHSGNIIVDADRQVHLIDISPLLHYDPAADESAMASLLEQILQDRAGQDPALARLLEVVRQRHFTLTQLRTRVSALLATGMDPEQWPGRRQRNRIRRRTLLSAVLAALVGVAIFVAIRSYVGGASESTPPGEPVPLLR